MDSPHLLHLGFLLLALAAPHPNIAMSTVGPTEGTKDSSPDSTNVTIYHCEDCTSCICKSGANNFESYKKIAETQNKSFSDVEVELVTNKTHITVCFKQAISCPEGLYGIFWKRVGGSGLSCGILNSGENGRGDNSTEKNICCEAEANFRTRNPALKCYTQKPHLRYTKVPADIPGNPEYLTSKKNSTGILFAFLFVVACTGLATMCYFLWPRQRGQASRQDRQTPDRQNLIHF